MKKICVVFHNSDRYNGATRSMLDLIETWVKSNVIQVMCLLPREGTAAEVLRNLGVELEISTYYGVRYCTTDKQPERGLRNIIKRLRIVRDYLYVKTTLAKRIKKHSVDAIYSNTTAIYVGAWLSQQIDIPHIWHIREFGEEDQDAKMLFGKKLFFNLLNKASKIIVISDALRDKYLSIVKDTDKLVRYYNDISPKNIGYYEHIDHEPLKLLVVGSIIEGKGHEHVVRAVKQLNDQQQQVELFLAGKKEGSYFKKMEALVNELKGTEYVHFLGHVSDMSTLKKMMDIEIVSSRCEAFGRITIEAMLSGLPVIGANTGCTKELIGNDDNGILYKWNDINDLTQKIIYAKENYKNIQIKANNAYRFALQFTKGDTANSIQEMLLNLLQ